VNSIADRCGGRFVSPVWGRLTYSTAININNAERIVALLATDEHYTFAIRCLCKVLDDLASVGKLGQARAAGDHQPHLAIAAAVAQHDDKQAIRRNAGAR
jgi:hypothetical protein